MIACCDEYLRRQSIVCMLMFKQAQFYNNYYEVIFFNSFAFYILLLLCEDWFILEYGFFVFFSSIGRHTRCALVPEVQTCALPISSGLRKTVAWYLDHEDWWRGILERRYQGERLGLAKGAKVG